MNEPYLDRTFYRVADGADFSDPRNARRMARFRGDVYKWPELLEHRHVVVLGEAGKGKTTEFKQQERRITQRQERAFFIRVEDLADNGLRDSFWLKKEEEFDAWKESNVKGFFFLDSVDEARLKSGTLERALKNFAQDLRGYFERVHWYLSCRVSDWRPREDLQVVRAFIKQAFDASIDSNGEEEEAEIEESHEDPKEKSLIVLLGSLNQTQVRQIADHEGVSNSDQFVTQLEEENLDTFSERPRDVQWLAQYWKRHGKFGSLREMISENIEGKLKDQRRTAPSRSATALTRTRAREGAELLATKMTLEGAFKIRLSVETRIREAELLATLPSDVLGNWTRAERVELLSRGLFTEATYGCVRFHHRSAQEYLTAQWLLRLRQSTLAESTWWRLLFREGPDKPVVPVKLRPSVAWLAADCPEVRDRVLEIQPEILLQDGDPEQYTTPERKRLLRRIAEDFDGPGPRLEYVSDRILDRIAHSELTDEVLALLREEPAGDVLCILLRVVQRGALDGCRAVITAIALDETQTVRVRIYAADALEVVGTDETFDKLTEYVLNCDAPSARFGGRLLQMLYPDWLSTGHLVELLSQLFELPNYKFTNLREFVTRGMAERCPASDLTELSRGIRELLPGGESQDWYDMPESLNPSFVANAVGRIVIRLFRTFESSSPLIDETTRALHNYFCLRRFGGRAYGTVDEELREALRADDQVRTIFWRLVEIQRSTKGETITRWYHLPPYVRGNFLDERDIEWLAYDARTRESTLERLLTLDMLQELVPETYKNTSRIVFLQNVADGQAALEKRLRRTQRERSEEFPYHKRRTEWRRKKRNAKKRKRFWNKLQSLVDRIPAIREGRDLGALRFLYGVARETGNSYGGVAPAKITDKYGCEEITDAFTEGCRRIWREEMPPWQHEESDWNTSSAVVYLGLTGLQLDVDDGLDFSTLSEELAEHAARYAVRELNGAPDWFPTLVDSHLSIVAEVWSAAALHELKLSTECSGHLGILQHTWRLPEELAQSIASRLLASLKQGNEASSDAVKYIQRLIEKHNEDRFEQLGAIAREYCEESDWEDESIYQWMHVWLGSEPATALEFLTEEWDDGRLTAANVQRLLSTLSHFREFHDDHLKARLKDSVGSLAKFVELAYCGVRPEDDVQSMGASIVGERDRAEEMRRKSMQWLGEIESKEAQRALQNLAGTEYAAPHRKWLLTKAARIHEHIAACRDAEIEHEIGQLIRRYGTEYDEHFDELGIQFVPKEIVGNSTLRKLFDTVRDEISHCPNLRGTCERQFYRWLGLSLQFLQSRQNFTKGNAPKRCSYLFPWQGDDAPNEFALQSDYRDFLEGSSLASATKIEVTDVGGGRADVFVDFGVYRFIAELKRELHDASRENLRKYLGQLTAYQSTDARIGLLLVLDLTKKPKGAPHITENAWVEKFQPVENDDRWAVVLRVPGNRPPPSVTRA